MLSLFICRLFIWEYAYVHDLIFSCMDFEAHHHTVFQVEVLNHEVSYTLLHHLVRKSVLYTPCVHNFHLKALTDTLNLADFVARKKAPPKWTFLGRRNTSAIDVPLDV